MQGRTILILGGAAVAGYMVYQRREKLMSGKDEEFKAGFAAGWITPGPFTILSVAALLHVW